MQISKLVFVGFMIILLCSSCKTEIQQFQCITDSKNKDAVKAFTVDISNADNISNPGLVILAKGIGPDEGFVMVNDKRFSLPAIPGASSEPDPGDDYDFGKAGFYASAGNDDLMAKIIIPLSGLQLKNGINKVVFNKNPAIGGFLIFDVRINSTDEKEARVAQLTYRVVTRGENPAIDDFDFVTNYNGERKRIESDLPDWAKRGKARYYRAGINFDHLDRMFEMFKEGHFNLVMLQVSTPQNANGEEFRRYKAFIDRCHENGIRVTFDGGAGGQTIRLNSISADSVEAHPEMEAWIGRDENGNPRWRRKGTSYWPDLNNKDYRNRVLETAEFAIDAGVDELYYDYAIGDTRGIVSFFSDLQDLIKRKGKNLTVFGNCKGNIIADEICDIGKSEGTEEAGVWDGHWVHNTAQAKFYYATGDSWKPYRSKYEGADPGVPNPGAHSVINEMKTGWKRPMAEARAFQSDFVIAEAGRKLLNGWLTKEDPVAMGVWKDICEYNSFFAANDEFYTDVTTVSRIGVLAPPVIPSFEASVKRTQLYNAMIEMNIMYDVLLLPKLSPEMLAEYDVIIVPDIPWFKEEQLASIRAYKENGGKLFVMGSSEDVQKLATVKAPEYLCHNTHQSNIQKEFLGQLNELLPQRIIQLDNAEYVLANVVQKTDNDQVVIHLVNYLKRLKNIEVNLNLEGIVKNINKEKISIYSPDEVSLELGKVSANDKQLKFVVSELAIYNMIVIN